ncbi:histone-lysine N-methyltransferase, H3 lysine-9 specific SUVH4-like [Rutidosis leptorrhynchoides]|uniref:histone-lysine N-methyltransferase, H3 lysine-9 specific SUVH4-like n=1 Tax=Rutidosis leptorrhynchoides TaxID=125765 RepID=UPI003A9A4BAA
MGPDNSMGPDVLVTKTIGYRAQKLGAEDNSKRCSPRLKKIPPSNQPFYGPYSNRRKQTIDTKVTNDSPTPCEFRQLQQLLDTSGSGSETIGYRVRKLGAEDNSKRCSPRLKKIPASKRPFYGNCSNRRKPTDDTKIKNVSPASCAFPLVAIELQHLLDMSGVNEAIGNQVQKLVDEENSKRCSPLLEKIPACKRPYYGPQPTDGTKIKIDSPTSCAFPMVATELKQLLDTSGGNKRCSPRLEKIPASKRPYYGPRCKQQQQQPTDDTRIKNDSPISKVHYNNECSSRTPIKSSELVCPDIANGQEEVHIPVTNAIDDTTITGFIYTVHNKVLSDLTLPPNASGCDCKGSCSNEKTCACAKRNGGGFPYVRSQGGRLIEAKDVVFECGPECGCGPGCVNRTSQRGLKYHLEIFRTSDRGWAVKTKDFIPSGAPICEYIGELRRNNELDNVAENDYIFEIDCCHTIKQIGGRERRLGDVSAYVSTELESADETEPEFCIDAGRIGNVARFINHSCEPNLFVQCVLSSHRDPRFARVVLFASGDILPMQELTYDYGYALDSVVDKNGNVRTLPCHCGTSECRKRLY